MRHFIQRGGLFFASVALAFAASISLAHDNSDKQQHDKHVCWWEGDEACYYDYQMRMKICVDRKDANSVCERFMEPAKIMDAAL